jgi:hypothetical protein
MRANGVKKNGRAVGAAIGFFIAVTAVNVTGVLGPFLIDARSGDASGFGQKLGGLLIGAQVVGVGLVLIGLLCVPGSFRAWTLKRRHPSDLVFIGTSDTDLRAAMRTAAGTTNPAPTHLSFAMVANSDGLAVWIGFFKPRVLYRFAWSAVADLRCTETGGGLMKVKALSITIDSAHGRTVLAFPVWADGLLSVSRRDLSALENLVGSLEAMRPHAGGLRSV